MPQRWVMKLNGCHWNFARGPWHGGCLVRSGEIAIVMDLGSSCAGANSLSQTAVASLERAAMSENSHASKTRIVILGGGFGGVYTARHLEKLCQGRQDVEIILVSRDNFLLMTPLLFEVCSGTLDLRHCSFPVCAFLRTTRFVEATVQGIDLERHVVHLAAPGWSRRLRIMIDWTFSLLFRPDI